MILKRLINIARCRRAFTVMEVAVAIGIFSLLSLAVAWILITSVRSSGIVWEQLQTQNDIDRVLHNIVDDARRAETSNIGSYPIATALDYEFIVYANIDSDSYKERVRYWLVDKTLKKGVLKPSGAPLSYNPANETVVEIAHNVTNQTDGNPVFLYYDETYIGSGAALTQPVAVTVVRVIRIRIDLERDPTKSPVPLHGESVVEVRNVKAN